MPRVKVIASLGPSTSSPETVESLVSLGVSGFRINFSHGSQKEWGEYVKLVREAEEKLGRHVALIGDLRGPSVRTGELKETISLRKGESVEFFYGEKSEVSKAVPVPVRELFDVVEEGDEVVMDDGRTRLRVVEVKGSSFTALAVTDSKISSNKALVIRGKEVALPTLSEKDLDDLEFAVSQGFDYIGLSYVRTKKDVETLREYLERKGGNDVWVIAKIETRGAVNNLEEIALVSDAVMVARGDLGMNFGLEEIPHLEREIVNKAIRARKPVIVATQLLESMRENQVPTRAEVVDVANAVEMGVDALMLSGETSIGKYPVDAVKWLLKIASTAEREAGEYSWARYSSLAREGKLDEKERFVKGVLSMTEDLNAKLLIFTMRGTTARRASTLKPKGEVVVGCPDERVLRKLSLLGSLRTIRVEAKDYEEGLNRLFEAAKAKGLVSPGDLVVLTYGLREPRQRVEVFRVV